ncbi:hypothetical protein [Pseudaeromonas pectinilytica]
MNFLVSNKYICYLFLLAMPWYWVESFILVHAQYSGVELYSAIFLMIKLFMIFIPLSLWYYHYGVARGRAKLLVCYSIVLFVYVLVGLKAGYEITNIILSIKNIYFWLFVLIVCYSLNVKFPSHQSIFLVTILFFSALMNVVYSIYIDLTYSGNPTDFYFYDLYNDKGLFVIYNFIRDGKVRAFGFVGSKLTLSQLYIIPVLLSSFLVLYFKSNKLKLSAFVLACLFNYGLWITATRNPYLAMFFSGLVFLFFSIFGITRFRFFVVSICLYAFSIYLVLLLSDAGIGDESSKARIPMLLSFLEQLTDKPFGHGIGSTGIASGSYPFFFESSLATIFMDLGVIGGLFYFGIIISLSFEMIRTAKFTHRPILKSVLMTSGFSLLSLFFLSNFTNIYDSSLFVFAIISAFALNVYNMPYTVSVVDTARVGKLK